MWFSLSLSTEKIKISINAKVNIHFDSINSVSFIIKKKNKNLKTAITGIFQELVFYRIQLLALYNSCQIMA